MGRKRSIYEVFIGNLEGKRPVGKLRHKWEDNIKMDLKEIGCEGVDWVHLVLVNMVVDPWIPLNTGNFCSDWATVGFLRAHFFLCSWLVGWLVIRILIKEIAAALDRLSEDPMLKVVWRLHTTRLSRFCSGHRLDLYLGLVCFKCCPEQGLSSLRFFFVVFLYLSRQIQGQYFD
jgi:hypothetical protein